VLLERGDVEVSCDFCNKTYVFDAVDVEQLFAPAGATAAGLGSVH
jgi:molecular chaperone Hsp33